MTVDAHIHLDQYDAEELDRLMASALDSGVDGVVAVSMDLASCERNRQLARKYRGRVLPAYGHHPEQPPLTEEGLDRICDWIAGLPRDEPFAIGEVGLPYFLRKETESAGLPFDSAPYLRQLERFVALAADLDRPLALHAVHEDADAVMDLLERYAIRRAHFHWFKGSVQTLERLIASGRFISVTPEIRYDEETRSLVRTYPLEQLMAETDGPWPFEGPYAGRKTEPLMADDVVREIAVLRGMNAESVRSAMAAGTRLFYGWPRES